MANTKICEYLGCKAVIKHYKNRCPMHQDVSISHEQAEVLRQLDKFMGQEQERAARRKARLRTS